MCLYIHELEIILKSIKSIRQKIDYENTKFLEINYLVSRYSLAEIVINDLSVKLCRNGKEYPFTWYYSVHPFKNIVVKNLKSDDLYSLCKAKDLFPSGIVNYDILIFEIKYTDADKNIKNAEISLQFNGEEWEEIFNDSPLMKNKRYTPCNYELISDDNTDVSLSGISFDESSFDFHICVNNYSGKELRLWKSAWFLSCIKNGVINNSSSNDGYDSIVDVPPQSIAEACFSFDNCWVEGCNEGILTAIETDTQNSIKATVSFTVSYDLGGEDDLAESDWIVEKIGVVPERPQLCKEKFEYRLPTVSVQNKITPPQPHSLTFADFLVYSYNFMCAKHHNTEPITASVPIVKKDGTFIQGKIKAAYCKTCNKYYVLKSDYDILKKSGSILCKQISEEKLISMDGNSSYNNLNPRSELRLLGYNVEAKEDLSENQRQAILLYAIESGLYSQERIISFLNWLIDRNSSKSQMENAINKWNNDLQFISNYDSDARRNVGVKSFIEKIYKAHLDDDLPF